PRPVQLHPDGARRAAVAGADLARREPVDIAQEQELAPPVGKERQRVLRLALLEGRRRGLVERLDAARAAEPHPGEVERDPAEPGAESGRLAEVGEREVRAENRLLDDVLGLRRVTEQPAGERVRPRPVAVDETGERATVAA